VGQDGLDMKHSVIVMSLAEGGLEFELAVAVEFEPEGVLPVGGRRSLGSPRSLPRGHRGRTNGGRSQPNSRGGSQPDSSRHGGEPQGVRKGGEKSQHKMGSKKQI